MRPPALVKEKMGLVAVAVVVAILQEPELLTTVEVAAVLYCRVRVGADELANRISLESKKAGPFTDSLVAGVDVPMPTTSVLVVKVTFEPVLVHPVEDPPETEAQTTPPKASVESAFPADPKQLGRAKLRPPAAIESPLSMVEVPVPLTLRRPPM